MAAAPPVVNPAPALSGAPPAPSAAAPATTGPPSGGTEPGAEGGPGRGSAGESSFRKNRIQVSNTKKPLYFYINLSKKFLQNFGEVELSGLGAAIATVVTIAEILKNNGLAEEKRVSTSTLSLQDQGHGGSLKVKISVVLKQSAQFHELMDLAAAEAAVAPPEDGHF